MDEVIKTKIIQAVSSKNFYFDSSLDKGAFLNAFELIAEVRNKVFHGDNVTLIRSPNNFAINTELTRNTSGIPNLAPLSIVAIFIPPKIYMKQTYINTII